MRYVMKSGIIEQWDYTGRVTRIPDAYRDIILYSVQHWQKQIFSDRVIYTRSLK